MKLKEIANIVGAEFSGDDIKIVSMNTLNNASSNELSFISNAKFIKDMATSNAGVILVDDKTKEYVSSSSVALVVENPYMSMAILSKYFAPSIEDNVCENAKIGKGSQVSLKAEIASGAIIGKNCTILAGVYVGCNSVIGDNTILYPNVVIYRDCIIGSECRIHANTTIGSDGFGFATSKMGKHTKIYQNGNVIVENDVEIGSSTTVDRAVFGSTIIKKGTRIDNLVHIGHNCKIGEYSVLVAQAGFAGSTKMGRNTVFGAQSGAAGHLEIAPFNTFAARSGVTKSIKESNQAFAGFPLMPHRTWLKLQGKIAKLLKA